MAVLEYILIALVVPMISSKSFGGQYYKTPNDTQTCVNDLAAWCEGMKYPTEGGSLSMVAVSVVDQRGKQCDAFCTSDSDGTNCTKNGSPWFNCSNKNELIYKGNVLVKDSLKGADNETCKTADNAFNDLFVQNLSYDNSTLKKELENGMETFFKAMEGMEEKIATMQRKLFDMFGGGSQFSNQYPAIPYYPYDVNMQVPPTQDQREKE